MPRINHMYVMGADVVQTLLGGMRWIFRHGYER